MGEPNGSQNSSDSDPALEATGSEAAGEQDVYRQVYVDETREELDSLVEALLTLEGDATNVSAINEAFRLVHSMKGSSAMMGFSKAAELAHVWEDLLDQFRSDGLTPVNSHVDLMLRCVDAFREFVEAMSQSEDVTDADSTVTSELVEALRSAVSGQAEQPGEATESPTPGESPSETQSGIATGLFSNLELTVTFAPHLQLPDLKARLIASRISDLGEIVHVIPDFDETEAFEVGRQFRVTLLTQHGVDEIREKATVDGVTSIEIRQLSGTGFPTMSVPSTAAASLATVPNPEQEPAVDSLDPSQNDSTEQPAGTAVQASETIRVEIQRLDRLMNLTGELVVSQERFRELSQRLGAHFRQKGVPDHMTAAAEQLDARNEGGNGDSAAGSTGRIPNAAWRISSRDHAADLRQYAELWEGAAQCQRKLADAVDQLSRVSDDLQRAVMETRMVPLAPLFNRFKRVVRDLAAGSSKSVKLKIRGEKTELDKRMIDELADPLIHLVRNAIDHGLESPTEREEAGKPATATITLSAIHRGNNVYISVADDGRGVNVERIRHRIVERNILPESVAKELSDDQIVEYIWHPGFSTAETVTDISGRGVGMDIVRNRINSLCGAIEFEYQPGQGTTFTIRLPLTLAIIPSLLLGIESGTYSVPLEEVREITRIAPDRLVSIHGRRAIELRGEFVPVLRLTDVLQWNPVQRDARSARAKNGSLEVVVLRVTGQSVGLEVDAPLGVSELVVKSLADNYLEVPGLSGASILGSGDISLMLDSAALVEMAQPGNEMTGKEPG